MNYLQSNIKTYDSKKYRTFKVECKGQPSYSYNKISDYVQVCTEQANKVE